MILGRKAVTVGKMSIFQTQLLRPLIHQIDKGFSEPAIFSAIATEASLPEAIAMPLSISSTVISSPGSRKICEPPIEAAYSLVRTLSVSLQLALSPALPP